MLVAPQKMIIDKNNDNINNNSYNTCNNHWLY